MERSLPGIKRGNRTSWLRKDGELQTGSLNLSFATFIPVDKQLAIPSAALKESVKLLYEDIAAALLRAEKRNETERNKERNHLECFRIKRPS